MDTTPASSSPSDEVIDATIPIEEWETRYRTSSNFQRLLEMYKLVFLLPSIFPPFHFNRPESEEIKKWHTVTAPNSLKLKMSVYVGEHRLFHDLIHYSSNLLPNYENYFAPALPLQIDIKNFQRISDILEVVSSANKADPRNIILDGGHLQITNNCPVPFPTSPFLMLLSEWKTNIWHFSVLQSESQEFISYPEFSSWFYFIKRCLSTMTQLRSLFLQCPVITFDLTDAHLKNINPPICRPFPNIPTLQFLQLDNVNFDIVKIILGANPQIKKLALNSCKDFRKHIKTTKDFPNIEEFSLGFVALCLFDVRLLEDLKWPVTKLSLHNKQPISEVKFLNILEWFKDSITNCYINNVKRPANGLLEIESNLPNLVKLELDFNPSARTVKIAFKYPLEERTVILGPSLAKNIYF